MPPEDSSPFRVVDLTKMVLKAVMKDDNEISIFKIKTLNVIVFELNGFLWFLLTSEPRQKGND